MFGSLEDESFEDERRRSDLLKSLYREKEARRDWWPQEPDDWTQEPVTENGYYVVMANALCVLFLDSWHGMHSWHRARKPLPLDTLPMVAGEGAGR